jgi:hypothetical protein
MRFILKISLLVLAGLSIFSCRKSFETDWDVDISAPIARSKLNIKNFFSDTLFQTDPTGLLHLGFSKKIAGFQLDSLVQIPDTVIPKSFPLPPGITVTPSQVIPGFPQTTDIDFDIPDGVELKSAIIQSGILKLVYSNTFTQPLTFSLSLPTSNRYGFPFTIVETINPGSNGLVKYYDISGYSILMTGINGNKTNTLPQIVNVMVASNAVTDVTAANQMVQADISYSDILPYYLEGYFGQQNIDLPYDSVALNISNNLEADNFHINTASINFKIVNEFGVDINAQLSNINSLNTIKNTSVALNASGLSNININRAGKTSQLSNPVFPTVKTISVNPTNSNLIPFLENLPDYLTYQGKIVVNPLGNISGSNDFAFLNTGISIYADVDMPLEINANYFKLVSRSVIDLTGVKQIDDINYGDIVIQATNGFPFDAVLQGYILDEKENVIDSLFNVPGNVIKMGNINASNIVINPVFTKLSIPLTKEKLANLKLCRSIKFVSRFDLPPQPPDIKILDTYDLDIIVSLDVNYKARKR